MPRVYDLLSSYDDTSFSISSVTSFTTVSALILDMDIVLPSVGTSYSSPISASSVSCVRILEVLPERSKGKVLLQEGIMRVFIRAIVDGGMDFIRAMVVMDRTTHG